MTQDMVNPLPATFSFDRSVPCKHRLVGGVKAHKMNETSMPGSPAL
ncbi:MAG: hypothetical protein H6Q41_2699 [Deltaproteobacteria bacterium]|jgi:hypothetical protein|nr:hypothetical protein [Deltaproteobacteria bacterium]